MKSNDAVCRSHGESRHDRQMDRHEYITNCLIQNCHHDLERAVGVIPIAFRVKNKSGSVTTIYFPAIILKVFEKLIYSYKL